MCVTDIKITAQVLYNQMGLQKNLFAVLLSVWKRMFILERCEMKLAVGRNLKGGGGGG